jgi:hypothetical protein
MRTRPAEGTCAAGLFVFRYGSQSKDNVRHCARRRNHKPKFEDEKGSSGGEKSLCPETKAIFSGYFTFERPTDHALFVGNQCKLFDRVLHIGARIRFSVAAFVSFP